MQTNNYEYEREIDLLDLFFYWLKHWKSFLAVLVAALVIGGGMYMVFGPDKAADSQPAQKTTEAADEKSDSDEPTTLAELGEQNDIDFTKLNDLSDKDIDIFFDYALTNGAAIQVENLVDVYDVYEESYESYQASKDTLTAAEASETSLNLSSSYSSIMATRSGMSACQKAYFSKLIGEKVDLTDAIAEVQAAEEAAATAAETAASEAESQAAEEAGFTFSLKYFAILVCVAILLHVMVVCLIYIFSDKIKRTEPVAAMIDTNEIGRFASAEMNAAAVQDIAAKKSLQSLGLVAVDASEAAAALSAACTGLATTVVDCLPATAADMETLCGLTAAVILVTVEQTKYADLRKMVDTLRLHQVEVLGVIVNN